MAVDVVRETVKPKKSRRPRKKRQNNKGYAFVLVFLAMLVIAGGAALFFSAEAAKPTTTAALANQDKKIFNDVSSSVEDYREIYEAYPSSLDELVDLQWLEDKPKDQFTNPITYKVTPDGKSYTLRSAGQDRRMGGADDGCMRGVINNSIALHFYTCGL